MRNVWRGDFMGYWGVVMQDFGYEVRRIPIPRTWVNRPQRCIGPRYVPSFTYGKGFARQRRSTMVKLTVLYGHPDDPDAFEEYYANTHMPLVDEIPNLQ